MALWGVIAPKGPSGSRAGILSTGIADPSGSFARALHSTGEDANSHRMPKSRRKAQNSTAHPRPSTTGAVLDVDRNHREHEGIVGSKAPSGMSSAPKIQEETPIKGETVKLFLQAHFLRSLANPPVLLRPVFNPASPDRGAWPQFLRRLRP
jgi:hypothetical protein